MRDSFKESKFNNLVSISSQCQPNAGSTRAQTALNSSLADQSNNNSMQHLESLRNSSQSITIHKEQYIKEHVQNEFVSKMLINRIREKTNKIQHGQAKVEDRPQSAGLKYLHKIQSQAEKLKDRENVNPHINIKRPASSRVFPPSEDYEELEKKIECHLDRENLDEKITPQIMVGKQSSVP
jgi:hypothetical protein